jgi:signal transduction histidine kinase
MTGSLSFGARIGLIMVSGLALVWVTAIAAYYVGGRSNDLQSIGDPAHVVAVVELMERTAPDGRALVERATSTDGFMVSVERSAANDDDATEPGSRFSGSTAQPYVAALAGRKVNVTFDDTQRRRMFRRLWPDILRLRIDLGDGDVLTIAIVTPLLRGPLGLPIGFGAGIIGIFIALIALLAMRRETKPLTRLAEAVDRIDLSPNPLPLPEARGSAPEIRALIEAFNRLQGRLGELLRSRLAMLGGISHDVRTFATRLNLRVEKIPDDAERERAMTDIHDMIRLLDDALLASRAGAAELSEELIEIDDLVRGEVADRQANGARIDFAAGSHGRTAVVLGDRLALRRVIANLADNAIKYGYAAHLRSEVSGRNVILTVDDQGPGIPLAQRAAMLEPFSRLETSRNRNTGGAGLGLAIARGLVEAHHGSLAIENTASGNGRVSVRLPLFET